MSQRCARCGTENRDAAKRCMECGQALATGGTPSRLCPAGLHPMDPGWAQCPYCASEPHAPQAPAATPDSTTPLTAGAPRPVTVAEAGPTRDVPPASPPPGAPQAAGPAADPEARRRATVLLGATRHSATPETRRIVALLVTYTWESAGQVFPIRTGRSTIGGDPHSDVYIPADPQMSDTHAVILYRDEQFVIDHEKGLNGTIVDGKPVDRTRPLANYSRIKAGGTVFTFIQVEPATARADSMTRPAAD